MQYFMPTNPFAWTILITCLIITAASVVALVSKNYDDTLTECAGLAMVAMAGAILIMQVLTYGFALGSGVAFMCAAGAVMAVAQVIKRVRQVRSRRSRHSRRTQF